MAWLFNNDAKVYEELYLMGGITPKIQTALNQVTPQLMALENQYPDVGLRQDLANALKRLPNVARAQDFAFTISQVEIDDASTNLFNENALLYAMVFGKNTKTWEGTGAEKVQVGLTLPEFFNYYTQMAVQNQENKGKTDLFGQPIEVERESADMLAETLTKAFPREFEDGVAKNNDMKAVFLTRAQTRRTPGQLSQIDLMDTVQPSLFGDTSTATAVNNLPWERPVNVTNPIFFNRMPDATDIEVAKKNGYDSFLLMDKKEAPTSLVLLDGSVVNLKPGAKIPSASELYKPTQLFQEQLDLANENTRLDDIYPEYKGETININGRDRTVYNSEGKRIAKSAEALRNFYKWFGDSKVVDSQGRPLVVYHGTNSKRGFSKFDKNKISTYRFGKGFYFSEIKRVAEIYSNLNNHKTMPVYLKIENPYFISKDETPNALKYFADKGMRSKGLLSDAEWQEMLNTSYSEHALETAEGMALENKDFAEYPKSEGYDGIIYTYEQGPEKDAFAEIVAFEPTQIKSTENRGTYSSDNPNIYYQIDATKTRSPLMVNDLEYRNNRILLHDQNWQTHIIEPSLVLPDGTAISITTLAHSMFPNNEVWALYKSEGGEYTSEFQDLFQALQRNIALEIRGEDKTISKGGYEKLIQADNKQILLKALEETKAGITKPNSDYSDYKAQIAVLDNLIGNIKDGYVKPAFNEIVSLSDGTHLVTHGVSGKPEEVKKFLKEGKVYNPSLYIAEKPSEYGYHSVVLFANPDILKRPEARIFDRDAYTTTIGRELTTEKVVMPSDEVLEKACDIFDKYFDLRYELYEKHSGSTFGDFALSMEAGLKNIKDPYYWNSNYVSVDFVKRYIIADVIERGLLDVDKTTLYKSQNNGVPLDIRAMSKVFDIPISDHTLTDIADKALELIGKQENKTREEVLDSYKKLATSRKEVIKATGEDATPENIAKTQRQHDKQSGRWRDVYAAINNGYFYDPEYELLESSGETGIMASIFTREIPFDAMVAEKNKTGRHHQSVESRKKIRKLAITAAKGNLVAKGKIASFFMPVTSMGQRVKKTDVDGYMKAVRWNPDEMFGRSDAKEIVAEVERMAQVFAKIYKTLTPEEQKTLTSGKVEVASELEMKIRDGLQKNRIKPGIPVEYALELMEEVYNHPVTYFEGKMLADVGTNEFVGAYVNESPAWDDVATMLQNQGVRVVRGSPADVKSATVKLEEDIGQNIRFQGRAVNGFYDPELEVIVLGRNSNTGTLPHEMAHFWANTIFNLVKSGKYNNNTEFMAQAMGMFNMLGVGLNQDALTRDQQEQFATMTEAVIFGMAPIPQGTELPMTAFLNWVPSKYKSILDIGYRDSTGRIVNPILDKQAVDWFNAWYANGTLPAIEMSPLAAQNTNDEQDNRIIPSGSEVMKVRATEMKAEADDLKRAREEQVREITESTATSERAAATGASVVIESQPGNIELSTPPEEKKKTITSFLIPGRGTNTREGMFAAARDYIAANREHAEEVAFGHPNEVMNDTGVDRAILIRALMEEYDRSDPKYAELYHNLAETVSLAGKTPGLSNDMNFQFYLSAVKQITDGMEAIAAIKYAGTRNLDKARRTFNSDIDAFIQENADKIMAANAENKDILVKKMFAEAAVKFKGDESALLAQEELRRVRSLKTKEAFIDWAGREIRKMLKATPDASMINKIMEESEKAQKAVKYLDSEDYAEMEAAGKTIRGWQLAVKEEQVPETWYSKLIGSWYPKAMLYNINTHTVNIGGNLINYGIVKSAVAAQYKEGNKVPERVLKQERDRLRALYNSSLISVAAMRNPTSPTLLHGEQYNPREGKSTIGKVADFSMDLLGKEDNWFRTMAYVDALGYIATADAKKTGQSPTDLFREYKKLNQIKGTRAYEARQEALNIADIAVFQQNGTLARNLKKVRDALNMGQHAGLGTLLGPFVKTPANIVEMGARAIAAPVTSTYHAVKGDWSIQDTISTGYFVLACILLAGMMADYEPPYEVPHRYDPNKPYDSIRIRGTDMWIKLDTFAAASIPMRIIASIVTGKGLGVSGSMNEVPLLGDIADTWQQTAGIERDPYKQGVRFAANVAYNRVNTAVPAILKYTLAAMHPADLDLEQIETGLPKTGIGRKIGRQYGLDGGETTTNDILRIFFNRLKIAAE